MQRVGYHCSHEQHAPSALLEQARAAERAGFAAAMCSDHFMPWGTQEGQGHSGFTWSWLGAAMQTTAMTFGTVTAPGQRYHPAILAQAIATLGEMFPDRFWVSMASGELLNEHVTDDIWPAKDVRQARLRECIDITRALLAGDTVTHRGHVRVREAKLYSRPAKPPPFIGAALSVDTAHWCGEWADGLITVASDPQRMSSIIEAFRERAGTKKPVFVQAALAYAKSDAEAERIARAWRFSAVGDSNFKADVALPEYFDAASQHVDLAQLRKAVHISTSRQQHVDWLASILEYDVECIYVHHVGWTKPQQDLFLAELAPDLLRL